MNESPRVDARKLKGFRDFSPAECRTRERIAQAVRKVAVFAGFEEISTPALEYREVLLGSGGEEADKECYTFVDHGERAVALRYDLTVPFARYVAEHQGTMFFPFKKLQIGEVWRGEKPQKGRYRQFCQADLDIIGADSVAADVEVVSCIVQALAEVLPVPFTCSVGNRVLLSALIRKFLPRISEAEGKVLAAIDKLKKIGAEGVIEIISALPNVDFASAQELVSVVQGLARALDRDAVRGLLTGESVAEAEFVRYCTTIDILQDHAHRLKMNGKVVPDLSLARGLGYYTGIVFESVVDQLPGIGSISGGGRYNQLVSRFSARELAGVGGSVGVDRVLAALEELQVDQQRGRRGAFVAIATDDAIGYGFEILAELRAAGLVADIGMVSGKLGHQFKHADRMSYAYVLTVGTEELRTRQFALKDLQAGTEERGLAFSQIAAKFHL